jgi:DnaD/phage-associated family protein
MDNIDVMPTGIIIEEIRERCNTMGSELVIHAIDCAKMETSDKWKWSYIKGILKRWNQAGYATVEDVKHGELLRESAKATPQSRESPKEAMARLYAEAKAKEDAEDARIRDA